MTVNVHNAAADADVLFVRERPFARVRFTAPGCNTTVFISDLEEARRYVAAFTDALGQLELQLQEVTA